MTYTIHIKVMPLKELLDPQGKAVLGGLRQLGFHSIQDVRVGKNIALTLEAASEQEAKALAEQATARLLANPVMEYYEVELSSNTKT
ncbi:MAG: phosphoribosylformylglycinamidine synthase subunit PurS [Chitinophagaceae bacterium]|nr:phosphoribosylformylglycinamidine synthase subunit PurS [Chitinophagaceae bacterium]